MLARCGLIALMLCCPPCLADGPLKLALEGAYPGVSGKIKTLQPSGGMTIELPRPRPGVLNPPQGTPTEGYYIGVIGEYVPSLVNARLVRVQVLSVQNPDRIGARVASGLSDRIMDGEKILLIRPTKVTDEQIRALPDLVAIEGSNPDQLEQMRVTRSIRNLQNLGAAFHQWYDLYGRLPPARLIGPDGKPWHSWRALLLPVIDEEILYRRYRFDEPWDGPNNIKLLDSMPRLYTDTSPGAPKSHFTRFAAVTGKGMTFSADGWKSEGPRPSYGKDSGIRMSAASDGTSSILMVGTISDEAKVPWTKPEDVVFGEDAGALKIGRAGSFAAPYQTDQGRFALFLRLDASVIAIREGIDRNTFHAMLTISGRERLDWTNLKVAFTPQAIGLVKDSPTIVLSNENGKPEARLISK